MDWKLWTLFIFFLHLVHVNSMSNSTKLIKKKKVEIQLEALISALTSAVAKIDKIDKKFGKLEEDHEKIWDKIHSIELKLKSINESGEDEPVVPPRIQVTATTSVRPQILVPTATTPVPKPLKCPEDSVLVPCSCNMEEQKLAINCPDVATLDAITQESINRAISLTRNTNQISNNEWLHLYSLRIGDSQLTTLDLTPLIYVRTNFLYLSANNKLVALTGPQPIAMYRGLIDVSTLSIVGASSLTTEGLGESLKYFSNGMSTLNIMLSLVAGGQFNLSDDNGSNDGREGVEFLPGMSNLVHLEWLNLRLNKIQRLEGGQFKWHNKLRLLHLSNNPDLKIGPRAFLLNDPLEDQFLMRQSTICLQDLDWTSRHFNDSTNSWAGHRRPMHLDFSYNKLDNLPQSFFEPFLNANDKNTVDVRENNLVCGNKMKWLKDQLAKFENRIWYCHCSNDEGKTCFTSHLIH